MRWYCPQASSALAGWVDLPTLASKKEFEAIRSVQDWMAQYRGRPPVTRIIRKPHGWEPPEQTQKKDLDPSENPPENPRPTRKAHLLAYYCKPRAYHKGEPWMGEDPVAYCFQDKPGDVYLRKQAFIESDNRCAHCATLVMLVRDL